MKITKITVEQVNDLEERITVGPNSYTIRTGVSRPVFAAARREQIMEPLFNGGYTPLRPQLFSLADRTRF